jgi:hypothetical protein
VFKIDGSVLFKINEFKVDKQSSEDWIYTSSVIELPIVNENVKTVLEIVLSYKGYLQEKYVATCFVDIFLMDLPAFTAKTFEFNFQLSPPVVQKALELASSENRNLPGLVMTASH